MQSFSLAFSHFGIVDVDHSSIHKIANDSEIYFVLEVDLDYIEALHNMHKDFPLAPTIEKLDRNIMWSEYQMGHLDQAGKGSVTTPKFVQVLVAKKNHTVQ